MALGSAIRKAHRARRQRAAGYESTMRTLLLQNQQIIIQQQNMMFMVMKQLQAGRGPPQQPAAHHGHLNPQQQPSHQQHQLFNQSVDHHHHQQQQDHHHHHHHNHNHNHHQQQQLAEAVSIHEHRQQLAEHSSQRETPLSQQQHQQHQQQQSSQHGLQRHGHLQQVAGQLSQEQLAASSYLTPANSDQEPMSDAKPDDSDAEAALSALLEGDGLLSNNLLYNPQTDMGPITPYKSAGQLQLRGAPTDRAAHLDQVQHHTTPSYYSSGCESLSTPRVERQQQRPAQGAAAGVSQAVVKNLSHSFRSPTKSSMNVQILSGPATKELKNSNKAKIIQSMNISEFLRQVHNEETLRSSPSSSSAAGTTTITIS